MGERKRPPAPRAADRTRRGSKPATQSGTETAMQGKTLAVVVTIAFSLVGVLGDYFLKVASSQERSLRSPAFYIGFVVYASTAFGWLYVMKHLKLGTIGVLYSVTMILLLSTIGVVLFGERPSFPELVGLLLAIASLVLLIRFA
jgi:drug/metabolite transporter (DMT)-like permease